MRLQPARGGDHNKMSVSVMGAKGESVEHA